MVVSDVKRNTESLVKVDKGAYVMVGLTWSTVTLISAVGDDIIAVMMTWWVWHIV